MAFPATRLRRLRMNPRIRQSLQETDLPAGRLIAPLFVRPGKGIRQPIQSMPGQAQWSIDLLLREARSLNRLGIRSILLFGIPSHKDPYGREAYAPQGIVQQAVRALKLQIPELLVITDLCFCEYTSHGHCGVIRNGSLDNDATLKLIAKTALAQARAGADIIAPSGMIDGMVRTIRQTLDRHGFQDRLIMSYSAKYASAFYGPFREAAGSAPATGDRKSHQMNPANSEEALREAALDVQEGADIVMVKPALAYLDIIRRMKEQTHLPIAAYNVSGEYAMVKAASQNGWIDEKRVIQEILTGIRRAGADLIITYHAKDFLA
ncbi:MAG: porphobilinogen synthase [Elusimicrobiota bacterium]|jgi:porphobilinogen synthase